MYKISEENYLQHSGRSVLDGAPVGSGRYPYGSGQEPYQNYRDFKNRQRALRAQGITDQKELANYFGMSIREYRQQVTLANASVDREDYFTAKKLKAAKWSTEKIAEKLGCSTGRVEDLLKRDAASKARDIDKTVTLLKTSLENQDGYIDVGKNSEIMVGVSRTKFDAALNQLKAEGYEVQNVSIKQQFGQGNTSYALLTKPGVTKKDIYMNSDQIRPPIDIKIDSDGNMQTLRPIQNVNSKRIQISYAETVNPDGSHGIDKDGVIELRRGVKDLDLGRSKYAQVRIGVDGTHYLKGMAVYADDLPDGIDIRFNTNKHVGTPMISKDGGKEVLKPMKDPSNEKNPFGAAIRPGLQKGALNIVNEEGHWDKWSKSLSSQFLSKQAPSLARRQLKLSKDIADAEFEDIKSLTNPTLKKYLLDKFADGCDADAVHLKAAALPRQASKVILPLPSLKDNECYAPTYDNGETLALIRHPHGGIFEIPVLKVNNKNKEGINVIGNARDGIGINSKTAGILSGADFDGDTVIAIPLSSAKIKSMSPKELDSNPKLKRTLGTLRTFDPKEEYPGDGLPKNKLMTDKAKGRHMGEITNLITDMSIKGANPEDLTKAVKYSMVVIDAPKHKLDYKRAAKDLGISELKKRYQTDENGRGGAGTIVSRAKNQTHIPETKEIVSPSRMTPDELKRWQNGEKVYRPTGNLTYSGKPVTVRSNRMRDAKDPYTLTSGGSKENPGTVVEKYYADYASHMKNLANAARKESRSTPKAEWIRSAEKTYASEVESLNNSLAIAKMNAPKERRAQALANSTVRLELDAHPEYDADAEKKARSRALEYARASVGAKKIPIEINDREWEAIQAGALSDSKVKEILNNTDIDQIRARATPKTSSGLSTTKVNRAQSMIDRGYTWREVANALGVSVSTLQRALDGQEVE